jgi:hypothetical protein
MDNAMYQTIQLSSRVSVQGSVIERLPDGEVLIRAGGRLYRGRPIAPFVAAARLADAALRGLRKVAPPAPEAA